MKNKTTTINAAISLLAFSLLLISTISFPSNGPHRKSSKGNWVGNDNSPDGFSKVGQRVGQRDLWLVRGRIRGPTVLCKDKGLCYKKKLTCPAKCFASYSHSRRGYGTGSGGGSCTMDCKKKCIAYC